MTYLGEVAFITLRALAEHLVFNLVALWLAIGWTTGRWDV